MAVDPRRTTRLTPNAVIVAKKIGSGQTLGPKIVGDHSWMRFVFVNLNDVEGAQLLSDAYAETLQTLRFLP